SSARHCCGCAPGRRRQGLRLDSAAGRTLSDLPRIWLLLLIGILLLRLRIARVVALLLVGILRIRLGLRRRLAAGGHARWRSRRRAEDGLERIELRRRRRDTESRKGRGNRTYGVNGSGHRGRSILESWCWCPLDVIAG